jgi:hypothetical protein
MNEPQQFQKMNKGLVPSPNNDTFHFVDIGNVRKTYSVLFC